MRRRIPPMKQWITFLFILFFVNVSYPQDYLSELLRVTVIDSVDSANSWGTVGYKSLHLTTDGQNIYLAAKKIWHKNDTDTATIILGTRHNGTWSFAPVEIPEQKVLDLPVQIVLDANANPLIFYKDRFTENGWEKHSGINALEIQGNTITKRTCSFFEDDLTKGERFYVYGSLQSPGYMLLERYWSNTAQKEYWAYSAYNYTSDTQSWAVTYNLDSVTTYYNSFTTPTATNDGEYFVHSCVMPTPDNGNVFTVGLFVYRKSASNSWQLDFLYVSDTLTSAWPYLYPYAHSIGKTADGTVYLIAQNSVENLFFRKTSSGWVQVSDNFPTAVSGPGEPGASIRPGGNERIQFANDGTLFWADMDGGATYAGSAEISFRTPDDYWGRIIVPHAPGYTQGNFWSHDFVITDDDSLIIVYEYAPSQYSGQKSILVEASVYIPDIITEITSIHTPSLAQKPETVKLLANYPNPFNPETWIQFELPHREHVTLQVFNALGQHIRTLIDEPINAGVHAVRFQADDLPAGLYFYSLTAGHVHKTGKMVLIR